MPEDEKPPVEEKKEEESSPQQLAIEIDDSEDEVKVVADADSIPAEEDEELKEHSEKVKRRINKLTAKLRESERRENAATEYARAVNVELEEMKQKSASLDNSYVNEYDHRVQTQEKLLKQELKKAIDSGDSEKQAEIQVLLANVSTDKDKVGRVRRRQQQQQPQTPVQQPQFQPPAYQPPPQPQTDPRAEAWAQRNEWFGEDRPMTLVAMSEHESLLEEGFEPLADPDSYYKELDKRIGDAFPHKFQKNKRRGTPRVAGASRTTINKKGKKEVVLTESEVKMADKLSVPHKKYAEQVEKIRLREEHS
tara:strand:+ start:1521 stop:2444 length:924 start_codon:yes stop_codon:yes gene_type:complete